MPPLKKTLWFSSLSPLEFFMFRVMVSHPGTGFLVHPIQAHILPQGTQEVSLSPGLWLTWRQWRMSTSGRRQRNDVFSRGISPNLEYLSMHICYPRTVPCPNKHPPLPRIWHIGGGALLHFGVFMLNFGKN